MWALAISYDYCELAEKGGSSGSFAPFLTSQVSPD